MNIKQRLMKRHAMTEDDQQALIEKIESNGWTHNANRRRVNMLEFERMHDNFKYVLNVYGLDKANKDDASFKVEVHGKIHSDVTGEDETVHSHFGPLALDELDPVITMSDEFINDAMEQAQDFLKSDEKKFIEYQQFVQQCDDLAAKSNDEVIAYFKSEVTNPHWVLHAAMDVVGEHMDTEMENKILALFGFKHYDMDDDADVATVKKLIADDAEYGMTPEEADKYVEEELVDKDVAVLEKLSIHEVGTIGLSNCCGWDVFRNSCREATQDDADKVMQFMLNSDMRDDFIIAMLSD